jgi:glucose/arabinose dehydrogenase
MRSGSGFGLAVVMALSVAARPASAALDDPAFTETFITTGVADITGLEWAPDGSDRLFFLRKSGEIRIIENGAIVAEPFATISPLATASECGLLSIAFDPNFVDNHYVYVFATVSATEQQIIRFTADGNVGTEQTVIVKGLPTVGKNHDGGALGFGPDGKLYWAIGDNGNYSGIQMDLKSLAAKVGRANADGSVPLDNPFYDGDGPNNDYIWASGFRNPFTMTFQPATGRMWLNVVGTAYEQIFTPQRGDNGGWNLYEANQPAGYISPAISFPTKKTSPRPLAADGAVRAGGVVTFTTTEEHRFQQGAKVTIAGVADASFNQTGFVLSVKSPTQFTLAQAGHDATSDQGVASSTLVAACVTGGTFWDTSAIPADYRGDFFFTDYAFGTIMRATLDASNHVTSVDEWAHQLSRVLDVSTGPDGNLYYARLSGNVHKAAYNFTSDGIVVSRLNLRMAEGGHAAFSVRLTRAPEATRTVSVARASGDEDVSVERGDSLDFTVDNWSTPQTVLVAAAHDLDSLEDVARLSVSSAGLHSEQVTVRATDSDPPSIVAVPAQLSLGEGTRASFDVSLSQPPSVAAVDVSVSLAKGDPDVTLDGSATLMFTKANWSAPQSVKLSAAEDDDDTDDSASVTLSSSAFAETTVAVSVVDNDAVGAGAGDAGGAAAASEGGAGDGGAGLGAPVSEGGQSAIGTGSSGESGAATGARAPLGESDGSSGCGCRVAGSERVPVGSLAGLFAVGASLLCRPRARRSRM